MRTYKPVCINVRRNIGYNRMSDTSLILIYAFDYDNTVKTI